MDEEHEMEDGGPPKAVELRREILLVARGVGESERLALSIEPLVVDGSLGQHVERRGDEELEA